MVSAALGVQRTFQGNTVSIAAIRTSVAAAREIRRPLEVDAAFSSCITRSNARSGSDFHPGGGDSLAIRSSTHLFSSLLKLVLSITFHVLLSKRVLCATQQRSNRYFVQSQDFSALLVTQSFAPKNQELCIAMLQGRQYGTYLPLV